MASKEKVQAFLKESDSHKHYSQIIDLSLTYFITRAEKDGKTEFAAELKKGKEDYVKDFEKASEVTESVLGEMFTDDELDNLIILNSNPALAKARQTASEIVGKILEKYAEASK